MAMKKKKRPRSKQVTNPNIRCFLESAGKHLLVTDSDLLYQELLLVVSLSLNNASSSSAGPLSVFVAKGDLKEVKFLGRRLLKVPDLPLFR